MNDFLKTFENKFANIENVFNYAKASTFDEKNPIRVAITRLTKSGNAFRAGRGLY